MEVGKIVIVGPPGVGKTTLRKVFFEGGSAKYLLEYALDPTHGQESIILNLSKTIGVFDLAGQENERWLNSDERDIFLNTEIIINVLDIRQPDEKIIDFAKRVISIRDELTPNSIIYLIIHKIDLIPQQNLMKRQMDIINNLKGTPKLRIKFTSITESYFSGTFALFIDILKLALGKKDEEIDINLDLIKRVFEFLFYFKTEDTIAYSSIRKNLLISEDRVKEVIDVLIRKNHMVSTLKNGDIFYTLTKEGKNFYNEILKRFDINKLKEFENELLGTEVSPTLEMPPFLGFFLSDKDGKTLLTVEVHEDALKEFFTIDAIDNHMFDVELIPMFISALEKFSQEINIEDLRGFKLKGKNQTMHIFSYEVFTFTIFTNPYINMKPIKEEIQQYFEDVVENDKAIFMNALTTGQVDTLLPILIKAKGWLSDLNKKYQNMILNLTLIDIDKAKELYNRLDLISENIKKKFDIIQSQIKSFKVDLMKSILEDKIEDVRRISGEIQDLMKKYT